MAEGDGSIAGAMAAEVHGSIAGRRLYRTNLRAAVNRSISRVPAGCVVATPGPGVYLVNQLPRRWQSSQKGLEFYLLRYSAIAPNPIDGDQNSLRNRRARPATATTDAEANNHPDPHRPLQYSLKGLGLAGSRPWGGLL